MSPNTKQASDTPSHDAIDQYVQAYTLENRLGINRPDHSSASQHVSNVRQSCTAQG